jgi:hypothetical protein
VADRAADAVCGTAEIFKGIVSGKRNKSIGWGSILEMLVIGHKKDSPGSCYRCNALLEDLIYTSSGWGELVLDARHQTGQTHRLEFYSRSDN